MSVHLVDQLEGVVGWMDDSPLERCSHALAAGGRVWVVDPIEAAGMDEPVLELGEPAAVVQLLDRHDRAAASYAERLGVPHLFVPNELPDSPFEVLPVVRSRFWREVALWWPDRRVLVCADAIGTVPHYYRVGGERLGVHPMLRLRPPRVLRGLGPRHVLVGHGKGAHGDDVAAALDDAIAAARRRIPRWLLGLPKVRRS